MEDKLEIWNSSLDDQDPMMLLIHRMFKQLQPYSLYIWLWTEPELSKTVF